MQQLAWMAVAVVTLAPGAAQDWPQWRGPTRRRHPCVPGTRLVAEDVDQAMARGGRTGYATPLIVGERIYVFTRQGENEVMTALDAARRRCSGGRAIRRRSR